MNQIKSLCSLQGSISYGNRITEVNMDLVLLSLILLQCS